MPENDLTAEMHATKKGSREGVLPFKVAFIAAGKGNSEIIDRHAQAQLFPVWKPNLIFFQTLFILQQI